MTKSKEPKPRAVAPIESATVYPIAVFKRRAGIGDWGLRQARKAGLRVRQVGNVRFVIGADFIEFLRRGDDSEES